MTGRVVHFEIPIDDSARGTTFYRDAFGWKLNQWGDFPYWTTEAGEGEGIGGALATRSVDNPHPLFYIAVDDVDVAISAVEEAGGSRLTKTIPIPGVGWSAHFEDSEGNRVGVFQHDPTVPVPAGPEG